MYCRIVSAWLGLLYMRFHISLVFEIVEVLDFTSAIQFLKQSLLYAHSILRRVVPLKQLYLFSRLCLGFLTLEQLMTHNFQHHLREF